MPWLNWMTNVSICRLPATSIAMVLVQFVFLLFKMSCFETFFGYLSLNLFKLLYLILVVVIDVHLVLVFLLLWWCRFDGSVILSTNMSRSFVLPVEPVILRSDQEYHHPKHNHHNHYYHLHPHHHYCCTADPWVKCLMLFSYSLCSVRGKITTHPFRTSKIGSCQGLG